MGPFQERNFFFLNFFRPKKKLTLPLFRCRDSQRRDHLDQYLVLLYLFIHWAKYIWAQTQGWSDHIGILVYLDIWIFGYLDIWIFGFLTWSDHLRVWAQKCLARWRKWCSSSSFASRSSLPWESRHPKCGKVSCERLREFFSRNQFWRF